MFLKKNNNKKDSGTTYAEVLIVLAILSIMALGTYRYIRYTSQAGEFLHQTIRRNISVYIADRFLTQTSEEIDIPYWKILDFKDWDETLIKVPYYQGSAEEFLILKAEDDLLTIETNTLKHTIQFPLCSLSLEPLLEADQKLNTGAVLLVKSTRNNFTISIPFYWGGIPCR